MKTPQEELQDMIADMATYPSAILAEMAEKLTQIAKRLAAGNAPTKVLIAVYDEAPHVIVAALASTAPVKVVSVDHRPRAKRVLHAEMAPVLADPTEFIEAVSDEAAEYLSSCKASDQLLDLSSL